MEHTLPATGYIRLPAYRLQASRAARVPLKLLGCMLQVFPGLIRVIACHLKKTDPQRVLSLQTEEEMYKLEAGIRRPTHERRALAAL